jgi:hypothetical protein
MCAGQIGAVLSMQVRDVGVEHLAPLYPDLGRFRAHCAAVDPRRVFVNDFAARCLGL